MAASPRVLFVLAGATLLVACGGPVENEPDPNGFAPPEHGYQIEVPTFTLAPFEEATFCYYTTLPSVGLQGIKRYSSKMTEGSHHLILFLTSELQKPDGTFDRCGNGGVISGGGGGSGFDVPVWAYAAQEPDHELVLPEGVGVDLIEAQPVVVNVHYLNTKNAPLEANITLNVDTFAPGERYIPANAFVTFHTDIMVPAGGSGTVSATCELPEDYNFFALSTHSHRFTTRASIRDGADTVVETTDWEHPAEEYWLAEPYVFQTGRLEYRCDYANPEDYDVYTGGSAETDEMCMAVGYFYPSEGTVFCLDDVVFRF